MHGASFAAEEMFAGELAATLVQDIWLWVTVLRIASGTDMHTPPHLCVCVGLWRIRYHDKGQCIAGVEEKRV